MHTRDFFKIVVTSGLTAAASGCQPAPEPFLPLAVPNEQLVPGVAAWFATVCRECPAGCGVLARNRDGRVVKLEGNPDHPVNAGALCIRGHAALQGLYHPDRFRGALIGGKPAPWADAEKRVVDKLAALVQGKQGQKIALVTGLESGTVARLMDEWVKALGTRPRIAYEPLAYESIRAANRITFGRDAIPEYAIGEATYLVSFGADFLETWLSPVGYSYDFARMHAFHRGRAGTFVHVEPRLSMTAANADQWLRNAPGTEGLVALAMLKVIVDEGLVAGGADGRALAAAAQSVDVSAAAAASGVPVDAIKRVAHDLAASRGGLAIGGGAAASGANATDTQVAVNLLNAAIGAVGPRVQFGAESVFGKASSYADMLALTQAMTKGEIEVLILGDVNPAYAMPAK